MPTTSIWFESHLEDWVESDPALPQPDFLRLAEAHGCFAMRVETAAGVGPAIDAAFSSDGPAVLDFRVEPEETVYPMVPSVAAVGELVCREERVLA